MSGYESLAKFYDALTKDYDYDKYFAFVKEYLGGTVAELGAGTGKFTEKYIASADKVYLVEQSSRMLSIANGKLLKYRKKCEFIADDMMKFTPMRKVDTVIAVCDVFNYAADIGAMIDKIDSYLSDGGYIIFDISSEFKLSEIIGNNVFYEDYDDFTYIWTNSYKGNCVDMNVTIFNKEENGMYSRSDDASRQYAHNADKIADKLLNSGYKVDMYDGDDYSSLTPKSQRILFIASKLSH